MILSSTCRKMGSEEIDRETFLKFYENHVRKGERELSPGAGSQ